MWTAICSAGQAAPGPEGDTQVFLSTTRDSQGKPAGPGTAISFKDVWMGSTLTAADLYIKWVFRSDDAVLTRFLLQVTSGT